MYCKVPKDLGPCLKNGGGLGAQVQKKNVGFLDFRICISAAKLTLILNGTLFPLHTNDKAAAA